MILRSSVAARAAASLLAALAAGSAQGASGECRQLADSRALSAALIGTIFGDAQSFDRVQATFVAIDQDVGTDGASAALRPLLASMNKHSDLLLKQRETVRQDHDRIRQLSHASLDLLEAAETLNSLMLQNGASPAEINAALQLAMLSQRLGRSADTFIAFDGVNPESVFLLGKDLKTFAMIVAGLRDGDSNLRLHAQRQPAIQQQLAKVQGLLDGMKSAAAPLLGSLQALMTARESQVALQYEADQLAHILALACAGSDGGAVNQLRLPALEAPLPTKKP